MASRAPLTAITVVWAAGAAAQGVPTVDPGLIARNEAEAAQRDADLVIQRATLTVQESITLIEQEQLAVLQNILDAQTSIEAGGDREPIIPDKVTELEDGGDSARSADAIYAPEDGNPGAEQLFGDAAQNVEELIIAVAQETHGLSGVSQAGFSVREWRFMLQALIWQESRFSIGARSPVGAFGLTQIMPGTAGDLGIYPEYYDSPRLQIEAGRGISRRCSACSTGTSSTRLRPITPVPAMSRNTAASRPSRRRSITFK